MFWKQRTQETVQISNVDMLQNIVKITLGSWHKVAKRLKVIRKFASEALLEYATIKCKLFIKAKLPKAYPCDHFGGSISKAYRMS